MKKSKCKKCSGTGEVFTMPHGEVIAVPCKSCNGKGRKG